MAERYLFFNSMQTAPGEYDREYKAQDFAEYFGSVLSSGLLHTDKNPNLVVSVDAGTMNTVVTAGNALIKGHLYENTTPLTLTHSFPEPTLDRIDRVVLRLDLRNSTRYIKLFVKEGVSATAPVAPALQRDDFIYELSLAQIRVRKNTVQLLGSDIVDERLDENLCGLVYSLISIPSDQLQNWIAAKIIELDAEMNTALSSYLQAVVVAEDALQTVLDQHQVNAQGLYDSYSGQLDAKLLQFENDFNAWFTNLQDQLSTNVAVSLQNQINIINNALPRIEQSVADVSAEVVTVSDAVTTVDNSLTMHEADDAAHGIGNKATLQTTHKTTLVGAINEAFTSASNGKTTVKNAITGVDPMVVVPADPTFNDLASAIGRISTGKKWASGTGISNTSNRLIITGLGFKPSIILCRGGNLFHRVFYDEAVSNTSVLLLGNSTTSGSISVDSSGFNIQVVDRSHTYSWIAFE